jgi:hypothetical protein
VITVKVTTPQPDNASMMLRLTPSRSGIWKHCQFHIDDNIGSCDWWFITHHTALKKAETVLCDPNHIIFLSCEPHEYRSIAFYRQFAKLVLCDRKIRHRSVLYRNALSWWVGINVNFSEGHTFSSSIAHDYDSLSTLACPDEKLDRISIITSSKQYHDGHRKRLDFIDRLMNSKIGNFVDLYGGGHNPIPDKLDALLPYKYHIALENAQINDYWTEKLADPLLAFCFPFYHGCPNISSYIPCNAYTLIDIESKSIFDSIEQALKGDLYSRRLESITASRKLILNDYNLFELMASIANSLPATRQICTIYPPHHFKAPLPARIISKIRRSLASSS